MPAELISIKLYLLRNPDTAWIALSIILFLAELLFRGLGVIFASLGALTVGVLMYLKMISLPTMEMQLSYFLGFTAGWTILLWNKVGFRSADSSLKRLVGSKGTVCFGGLKKGRKGKVKISGKRYKAKLSPSVSVPKVKGGTQIWVHSFDGKILLVGPTPSSVTIRD